MRDTDGSGSRNECLPECRACDLNDPGSLPECVGQPVFPVRRDLGASGHAQAKSARLVPQVTRQGDASSVAAGILKAGVRDLESGLAAAPAHDQEGSRLAARGNAGSKTVHGVRPIHVARAARNVGNPTDPPARLNSSPPGEPDVDRPRDAGSQPVKISSS